MTWLWDKVRQSLRSGRLRIRIQKFLEIRNTVHLLRSSVDNSSNPSSECEDDDLTSYFGVCSNCKLAIRHCRNFHFISALDFLSARSTICPFCGLRYREAVERQTFDNNDAGTCDEIVDGPKETTCGRELRSRNDRTVVNYRLPPISDYQSDANRIRNYDNDGSSLGRVENLNSLLSLDSRINLLLPPITKDNEFDPIRNVESRSRSSSFISKIKQESHVCKEGADPLYCGIELKTRQEFLKYLRKAHQSENYNILLYFYMKTFSSFRELCSLLKIDPFADESTPEDPGLKLEFLYSIHDAICDLPSLIQKTTLKSIINSLLEEWKGNVYGDEARSVFILLQCPIFSSQNSYIVFAHLLRYCINLPSSHHQLLVGWFKILDVKTLRVIIRQLMQFIALRQFSAGDKFLPPMNKCRWWIPAATKVLALINAANNDCSPPRIGYTELYNYALDHLDLMQDYYVWQNCRHPGQFAYCQYPFILSILAKRFILTKDSEQQMILNARKSLVTKMSRHQAPQIDIFFLNINVRRSHLVNDSLNEITCKQRDLKKKLKVSFVGEPGLDMGGLTKEWFLLLVREIFDSSYGMFVYHPHSHCYWFSTDNADGNLSEYNLIGVLMGLAVYNSNILDLRFPSVCYRKLLTPPVVPHVSCNKIGVIESPTLDDLEEIMPDVTNGLKELLKYDGNVEEDMGITFQISVEEFGTVKTFQLKPNGEEIPVNNQNREEYVNCYLNWVLNIAIYKQFEAFYLGFHSVCASNALIMLRGEEVEMLVCGSQNLNLSELREVTEYDGFDPEEECMDSQESYTTFTNERYIKYHVVNAMTYTLARQVETYANVLLNTERLYSSLCLMDPHLLNILSTPHMILIVILNLLHSVTKGWYMNCPEKIHILSALGDLSVTATLHLIIHTTPDRNFWEIVEKIPHDLKRKFLLFTTGSDRIPIGGITEMSFKITRLAHKVDNLPEAHTCFNQLVMPRYKNKNILREKLVTAISNSEGFGLE